MSTINAYKYAGKSDKINPMIFRYAVISSVWGMEIPKDIDLKRFSDEAVNVLKAESHSELTNRLIFLYGAGVISEETVVSLICYCSERFSEFNKKFVKICGKLCDMPPYSINYTDVSLSRSQRKTRCLLTKILKADTKNTLKNSSFIS